MRKKIVTMAIIAAMSGAMATTAITCSASTFADAVNDIDDDFDANKTEEENQSNPLTIQKMQKAWRRFYQERLCGTDRRLSWLRMTGRWQIMPTEYFLWKILWRA